MNTIDTQTPVGLLVSERPGRSRLFEQLGIDYCCGGKKSLDDACAAHGLDPRTVATMLEAFEQTQTSAQSDDVDAADMPMAQLADHIENTHHAYLRRELPRLTDITRKVADVHGDRHPDLRQVADVFAGLRQELEQHMLKEEQILFPMVRQIDQADQPLEFHCGSLANPINVMEHEHDNAGNALARLRELTDGFTPPADACNTWRVMLDALHGLEQDLHRHIHKENNVLFPRALQREAALASV